MNGFGGSSNYPPGHPTGVSRGELGGAVYYCEPCNYMLTENELDGEALLASEFRCKFCKNTVERDECQHSGCGNPATHIDVDQAVNCPASYCDLHHT